MLLIPSEVPNQVEREREKFKHVSRGPGLDSSFWRFNIIGLGKGAQNLVIQHKIKGIEHCEDLTEAGLQGEQKKKER